MAATMKKAVSGALAVRDAGAAGGRGGARRRMPGCSARKPGVGPRAEAPSPAGGPAARPARAPRVVLGPRPAKAGRRPGTLGGLWAAPRGAEDGPGECEGPAAQALSLGCRKPQVPLTAAGHTAGRFTWVVASDPPRFTGVGSAGTAQCRYGS